MVVTKRNGENPSVRTSAFFPFSLLFLLPAALQVQSAGEKRGEEVKRGGGWGSPASLLVFRFFF